MTSTPPVPRLQLSSSPQQHHQQQHGGGSAAAAMPRTLSMKGRTASYANAESSQTSDLYARKFSRAGIRSGKSSSGAAAFSGIPVVSGDDQHESVAGRHADRLRVGKKAVGPPNALVAHSSAVKLADLALGSTQGVPPEHLWGVGGGRKHSAATLKNLGETPMPEPKPSTQQITAPPWAVELKSGRRRKVPAVMVPKPHRKIDRAASRANIEGSMAVAAANGASPVPSGAVSFAGDAAQQSSPSAEAFKWLARANSFAVHHDPASSESIVKTAQASTAGSFSQKRHYVDPHAVGSGSQGASSGHTPVLTASPAPKANISNVVYVGESATAVPVAPAEGKRHSSVAATTSFKPGLRFSPRVGFASVKTALNHKQTVTETTPFFEASKAAAASRNIITWKGFSARRKTPKGPKRVVPPAATSDASLSRGQNGTAGGVPAAGAPSYLKSGSVPPPAANAGFRSAPFDTSYSKSPFAPPSVRVAGHRGKAGKAFQTSQLTF